MTSADAFCYSLQASRQQLLQHLQEARERSRRLQDSLRGSAARPSTAARQSPVAELSAELPTLHKQFDPGAFVDRKVRIPGIPDWQILPEDLRRWIFHRFPQWHVITLTPLAPHDKEFSGNDIAVDLCGILGRL